MGPVAQGPPKKLHTREQSGIRLDRQLRWWHDDEPVEHPKIIEAFNRGLSPTVATICPVRSTISAVRALLSARKPLRMV